MANINPFLSKPEEWVAQLAELSAERKKLEDREESLKKKLKLHMQEKGLESVDGEKFEFKRSTGERTDFSQGALAETFGAAWLNDAITRLPKKPFESFRLVEKKDITDPKAKEIVDHFSPQPGGAPNSKDVAEKLVTGLGIQQVVDEQKARTKPRKEFPR